MDDKNKPKVFVITPFSEDFLALYEELKRNFDDSFKFTNAGDLDNQQNILQDIIEGIYQANVIIADLTGLNANVFYELGLAHAMNKKVIIITQDIGELPFDIKSYRSNEYSLQFNKLSQLIDELSKLLFGAIDGSVKYGSPISDYIPYFYNNQKTSTQINSLNNVIEQDSSIEKIVDEVEGERGFIDYISEIEENMVDISNELENMTNEVNELEVSISATVNEITRISPQKGNSDVNFVRSMCRKLSTPIDLFAEKLRGHVNIITHGWDIVENSYLSLLDNQYMQQSENIKNLNENIKKLNSMQDEIIESNGEIETLISILRENLGVERRLNKAINMLIYEFEKYLLMTETMSSSIDRIVSKSDVIKGILDK